MNQLTPLDFNQDMNLDNQEYDEAFLPFLESALERMLD
jgi:hypothetical protein